MRLLHVRGGAFVRSDGGLHRLETFLVEERQVEMRVVQRLVTVDLLGEWGAEHSSDQLRDDRRVRRTPEGHQHLGAGAVPPSVERGLEQDDAYPSLPRQVVRVPVPDRPAVGKVKRFVIAEAVNDLVLAQVGPFLAKYLAD